MSLSTATDWRSLHQILSQRPPKKETSYTSSSQRIFSKSEERITPQREPRENKAALPLCALTHWKLIHTVWSYLWHQYNMMQTRRRGIQVMLKALQRFLTLHKLLSFHQVSLLFSFPVWVVWHYCWALSSAQVVCLLVQRLLVVTLTFTSFFHLLSLSVRLFLFPSFALLLLLLSSVLPPPWLS